MPLSRAVVLGESLGEPTTPNIPPQGGEGMARPDTGAAKPEQYQHLSERQFEWLSWRLGAADDLDACEATDIDQTEVMRWRGEPGFEETYRTALANKRAAFRQLSTHLLPKALRVINRLLEADSLRANQAGLQYLLKSQGLLEQAQTDPTEQLARLLDLLRTPGTVVVSTVSPRD